MRLISALFLLFAPMAVYAEEVTEAATVSSPPWLPSIITGIITIIVLVGGAWARKKLNVATEKIEIDKTKSLMEQRNFIIDNRLIPFALGTMEHWMQTQLPAIALDLVDGGEFKWRDHWSGMMKYTKTRVLQKFGQENEDLLDFLGENELDRLLDRIGMKLIAKLPPSVAVFVPPQVLDKLTDKASEFVTEKGKELLGV